MTATLAAASTAAPVPGVGGWKRELVSGRAALHAAFVADPQPQRLLARQAALVDRILRGLWLEVGAPRGSALVAVGGYGRGALLPKPLEAGLDTSSIERFIGMLWDAGLEIAHSVRTIDECETEMAQDVTIRTSLLEHRLLAGTRVLYDRFRRRFAARSRRARIFRSQGAGTAAAPPALSGHSVQPRAQRQGEPGRGCATCRRSSGLPAPRGWGTPGTRLPSTGS